MRIKIIADNLKLTARMKSTIYEKLGDDLDRLLRGADEDLKTATVKVEEKPDYGYKINFDMWLPGKVHIYGDSEGEKFLNTVVELREEIETQLKEYTEEPY